MSRYIIWADSFLGLQRDLCPHRNVVKPLRRGYILLSASLPEGSHRGLNFLNWVTGQNHTNTRYPYCLPGNKGVWRELMLKTDNYSFSQEQVTLVIHVGNWPSGSGFYSLFLSSSLVPRLWRHTGLPWSASCSGWTVIIVHFIMHRCCFVVSRHWYDACHRNI